MVVYYDLLFCVNCLRVCVLGLFTFGCGTIFWVCGLLDCLFRCIVVISFHIFFYFCGYYFGVLFTVWSFAVVGCVCELVLGCSCLWAVFVGDCVML